MPASVEDCFKMFAPGSGLFGTHVTWEDIEQKICFALNTQATFGEKKKVTNIGDGKGFFSRICLIEPDWKNVKVGEELPFQFIAKIPTILAAIPVGNSGGMDKYKDNVEVMMQFVEMLKGAEAGLKQMHNSECTVYDLIEKYGMQDRIGTLKIFYKSRYTDNEPSFILMEYKPNAAQVNGHDNLSVEALYKPLRALAALEAVSLRFTDEEKSCLGNRTFKDVYGQFLTADKFQMFLGMAKEFGQGELNELVDELSDKISKVADIKLYDTLPEKLGMSTVLCHGDLWCSNILWTKKAADFEMDVLIDYQNAHYGMAVTDIVRFLSGALSCQDRRDHWEKLLELFYSYLLEELDGEPAPYNLHKLKESYKIYFPIGSIVGVLPMLVRDQPLKDEEEKQKVHKMAVEKAKYLLEDILEFIDKCPTFM